MIEIEEMTKKQILEVLRRVGYGHLGLSRGNHPYVVPINYAYEEPHIYIYTTEGKKTEIIDVNPEICLQIEEVKDAKNWQSVIVIGEAVRLTDEQERERALETILATNPTLTPAVSIRWMDNWVRENIEVIYQIQPRMMTGRRTSNRKENEATFAPQVKGGKANIY